MRFIHVNGFSELRVGYASGATVVFMAIALAIALLQRVLVNSACAYGLARFGLRGRAVLLAGVIALIILPLESIAVPLLLLFNRMGITDTHLVQIIPFIAQPFSIFLFHPFVQRIPRDLDEAALMDGASPLRIWRSIILPLSAPVMILRGLEHWNGFLWPLMATRSDAVAVHFERPRGAGRRRPAPARGASPARGPARRRRRPARSPSRVGPARPWGSSSPCGDPSASTAPPRPAEAEPDGGGGTRGRPIVASRLGRRWTRSAKEGRMRRLGVGEWLAVGRAIAGGDLLRATGPGQHCRRFERRLAEMTGARHALTVNSGTSALSCALAALGVGPGDEVLVPAYTWMSSAAAPLHVGAVPVLVDIDETMTIDPADLERKITPHTRAILPVHMLNRPCDMDRILEIARRHGLLVVEDACQAVGVRYRDRFCGAIGDAGAFSFNQYKNMTIGEGGAVLLREDRAYARAYNFHDLGVSFREQAFAEPGEVFVGLNLRANEMQGAMLNAQLDKLPRRIARMRRRHEILRAALERAGYPVAPHHDPGNAVGLVVTFEREREAVAFAERRVAHRLHDNSKHVYTNWGPILGKRTHHPRMDPWAWAGRPIEYSPDMCERTLDLLRRSCRVNLGEGYPLPAVMALARSLGARASRPAARWTPTREGG